MYDYFILQSKLVRRISKRNVGIKKNSQSEGLPQIYESFELTKKVQAKQDVVFIVMCLKMHFVFSSLSDS
jgi:cGMP-dependent protein kinase